MMIMESGNIGFGYCWCHAGFDLGVGASGLDGLCNMCRDRGAAECEIIHRGTRERLVA